MGTGRRFEVTVGLGVATARVVVGVAAVVVVASAGAAESDDAELHALPNISATTMAPVIDESLRITELIVPLKPISQYEGEVSPTFACREWRATLMVGLGRG